MECYLFRQLFDDDPTAGRRLPERRELFFVQGNGVGLGRLLHLVRTEHMVELPTPRLLEGARKGLRDYLTRKHPKLILPASLTTPMTSFVDFKRAFAKIASIKDSIKFWGSGAESADFMTSSEVDMLMAWTGRGYKAIEEQKSFDLVVCGGGLTAAMTAHQLALEGVKVLVLETGFFG